MVITVIKIYWLVDVARAINDFANICILMKLDVVFMEKDDNDFDVVRVHTN